MAITDELRAQILRWHFVEHWRVGTIARQLGVHHSTVERVLGEAGVERSRRPRRPSSSTDPALDHGPTSPTLDIAGVVFGYIRVSQRLATTGHYRTRNAVVTVPAPSNVSVQNLGGFCISVSA